MDIILKINNCNEIFSWTIVAVSLSHFFHISATFNKKATTFKNISLQFSINKLEICPVLDPSSNPDKISFPTIYKLQAFKFWSHIRNWAPWWFSAILKIGDFGASWRFSSLPQIFLKVKFYRAWTNFYTISERMGAGLSTLKVTCKEFTSPILERFWLPSIEDTVRKMKFCIKNFFSK